MNSRQKIRAVRGSLHQHVHHSTVWNPEQSMSEQLKKEKAQLFGTEKAKKKYPS